MDTIGFIDISKPVELTEQNLRDHLKEKIQSNGFGMFQPVVIFFPSASMLADQVSISGQIQTNMTYDQMDQAISSLYRSIQGAWVTPFAKYFAQAVFAYPFETCFKLFIESFGKKLNPRLTPELKVPSKEVCAKLMKEFVTSLPWSYQGLNDKHTLSQQGSTFTFTRFGERGEVEQKIETTDTTEAYWLLFDSVMQFQLNLEDFNKTFEGSK